MLVKMTRFQMMRRNTAMKKIAKMTKAAKMVAKKILDFTAGNHDSRPVSKLPERLSLISI